jgi:hypothetical protein
MKPEIDVQSDDVAQVWKDANLRRDEDLGIWLKQFFRRRSLRSWPTATSTQAGRVLAVR